MCIQMYKRMMMVKNKIKMYFCGWKIKKNTYVYIYNTGKSLMKFYVENDKFYFRLNGYGALFTNIKTHPCTVCTQPNPHTNTTKKKITTINYVFISYNLFIYY